MAWSWLALGVEGKKTWPDTGVCGENNKINKKLNRKIEE